MPTSVPLGGVPEIVGADVTVIEKAASEALAAPSATLMTMPVYVPTLAAVGVPLSCPVVELKVAQAGMPVMEKDRVPPAESEALGWNEYA